MRIKEFYLYIQYTKHLTIVGVHGQPVASCHDIFIALVKHITACILSKGTRLTVACILAGRELTHVQDWQATFMMDNIIYSYIYNGDIQNPPG